jgi:nitrite reductase/ring-hydroxylating ferredoxin subunit
MAVKSLKRSIIQRIFGIPATKTCAVDNAWEYREGQIILNKKAVPELAERGGAVRIEGKGLPERILLIKGDDDVYHAFINRCAHMGRRLDPVPGASTIQCCSVSKSTYNYIGQEITSVAKGPVKPLAVHEEGDVLRISLEQA